MKHVPWPAHAERPNRCGATVTLYWAGEYEACCTRAQGHESDHSDGIGRPLRTDETARLSREDSTLNGGK